jgi:hypothetical protein
LERACEDRDAGHGVVVGIAFMLRRRKRRRRRSTTCRLLGLKRIR